MHYCYQIMVGLLFSLLHCNSFDKSTQTNIKCSWMDLDLTCNFQKEERVQMATLMSSDQTHSCPSPSLNRNFAEKLLIEFTIFFYMGLVVLKQTDGLCRDLLVHQLFPRELWCPEYTHTHSTQ